MLEHQHCFSVKRMAMGLQVSRSGYYDWCKNGSKLSNRALNQQVRDRKIRELFDDSKGRYGVTRIQKDLVEDGSPAAIKTISDSMRRQKLVPKAAKKFKLTTDSDHQLPIADNLLDRDFSADAPNQKWVQDITYLWTSEGWLYLAVVIDLYSRAVVGWSMNERMNASLVTDSLTMAMFRRGMPKGLIIHSDRGSQYCSYAYRDLAKKHDFKISMSRKGNCWDNAVAESFFHSLKVEAIQFEPVMTRTEMRQAVFEYIDVDYNRKRRHSSIGYTSPFNFELKNIA
jgi:putative transposase